MIDFFLHLDHHLFQLVNTFGGWSYLIFFIMIFIETGIVIFPFLPGDSLLFAAAALAANPKVSLDIRWLFLVFFIAAVLGDTANYEIGRFLSQSAQKNSWFKRHINPQKVKLAEHFFEKHGGKTIVLARFMPFIRTFVPFVSGASKMHYRRFIIFNITGGFLWISLCLVLGYQFGNVSWVKDHFSLVAISIVLVSLVPVVLVNLLNRSKA